MSVHHRTRTRTVLHWTGILVLAFALAGCGGGGGDGGGDGGGGGNDGPSTNADLSALTLSAATLDQIFQASLADYTHRG